MRLVDEQTFELLDRLQLQQHELACSLCSTQLGDDPATYYVVGTAFAPPNEPEPTKVRQPAASPCPSARLLCSPAPGWQAGGQVSRQAAGPAPPPNLHPRAAPRSCRCPLCARQSLTAAALTLRPYPCLPPQGRIFVLAAAGGKLCVVCEKETRGAVYSLAEFQGRLLAGINSRVQMYK